MVDANVRGARAVANLLAGNLREVRQLNRFLARGQINSLQLVGIVRHNACLLRTGVGQLFRLRNGNVVNSEILSCRNRFVCVHRSRACAILVRVVGIAVYGVGRRHEDLAHFAGRETGVGCKDERSSARNHGSCLRGANQTGIGAFATFVRRPNIVRVVATPASHGTYGLARVDV